MKKLYVILLALVLAFGLTACSKTNGDQPQTKPPADAVVLSAKIMDISGTTLLLANMGSDAQDGDIYSLDIAKTLVISSDGDTLGADALKAGMLVEVAYDGTVMESFPMQLGNVSGVYFKEQGDDIAGMYKTVINDLYEVDPGLNDGIDILAFDLNGVINLSEPEKTALVYLVGNAYGLQTVRGTFDELAAQGYFSGGDFASLYFANGIFITVEDTQMQDGRFTFNAEKWRSGLGAYFFNDCTAKKTDGSWTYTVGSQAIS